MKKIAKNTILMVALFMGVTSMTKAFTKAQSTWYYNGGTSTADYYVLDNWDLNDDHSSGCTGAGVRPCSLEAADIDELEDILDSFAGNVSGLRLEANTRL